MTILTSADAGWGCMLRPLSRSMTVSQPSDRKLFSCASCAPWRCDQGLAGQIAPQAEAVDLVVLGRRTSFGQESYAASHIAQFGEGFSCGLRQFYRRAAVAVEINHLADRTPGQFRREVESGREVACRGQSSGRNIEVAFELGKGGDDKVGLGKEGVIEVEYDKESQNSSLRTDTTRRISSSVSDEPLGRQSPVSKMRRPVPSRVDGASA